MALKVRPNDTHCGRIVNKFQCITQTPCLRDINHGSLDSHNQHMTSRDTQKHKPQRLSHSNELTSAQTKTHSIYVRKPCPFPLWFDNIDTVPRNFAFARASETHGDEFSKKCRAVTASRRKFWMQIVRPFLCELNNFRIVKIICFLLLYFGFEFELHKWVLLLLHISWEMLFTSDANRFQYNYFSTMKHFFVLHF